MNNKSLYIFKHFLLSMLLLTMVHHINAQKLLIPMDLAQTDHLKAYGLTYWALTKNVNTEIIDLLLRQSISVKPNEQQEYILEMIEGFYSLYDIGKIVWPCGLGKALLSILIVNLLNFKSIVIGVPGNNLQKQIKNEIQKIFPNKNNILFVGGDETDGIKSSTDKTQIIKFLNNNLNSQPKFVISTYHSCHLLFDIDIAFEIKIGDERYKAKVYFENF